MTFDVGADRISLCDMPIVESTDYAATGHWEGDWDEPGLQRWVEALRRRLAVARPTLGLVFLAPRFFDQAAQVLEILQVHGRVQILAGCSSNGLIVGGREIEEEPGIAVGLYHLPDARLTGCRFTQTQIEEANGPAYWHHETGVSPDAHKGWLVFADPFSLDGEGWLASWNEAYPHRPVLGGLASGQGSEQRTQVYLNGQVFEDGGVAISFGGGVGLRPLISQGCTPIGEPWTITRVEGNLIHEIGNRPAYEVLLETFNGLPKDQQRRAQGNLFVGLVSNEYKEDFQRGDFLIRNLLGGDPDSGILAVGARPRPGQSLQFQCRDAAAATEDLLLLLDGTRRGLGKARVFGGCLCSCSGRGQQLFGVPDHDASLTQRHLGPVGLTGFFCNGEIGPVGERNFLHGYTASLALFVEQ